MGVLHADKGQKMVKKTHMQRPGVTTPILQSCYWLVTQSCLILLQLPGL